VLFPSLFALGKYHAVAAVSRAHFLELHQFTLDLIADAFLAMRELVVSLYRQDTSPLYVTVNANCLFPAGASLMHPHVQILITSLPYTQQASLVQACHHYFVDHATAYHQDLIQSELANAERYIAQTGAWHWLCVYAQLGSNEILGVHESCDDFPEFDENDLTALADGCLKH